MIKEEAPFKNSVIFQFENKKCVIMNKTAIQDVKIFEKDLEIIIQIEVKDMADITTNPQKKQNLKAVLSLANGWVINVFEFKFTDHELASDTYATIMSQWKKEK